MKNKTVVVIPARYASTRFPGKPLAMISGKPMIGWVIEGSKKAKGITEVLVATDDLGISEVAEKFGAKAVMTDTNLPSGTDRIWAAVKNFDYEIVINVQGDEPLVNASLIEALAKTMEQEPELEMATLAHEISEEELNSPNSVKVVVDNRGNALYFSRMSIPYSRNNAKHSSDEGSLSGALKHIGMYAYRKSFLEKFCAAPQAEIERAESLEQLRALYLGANIRVIKVDDRSWGVDTPSDIQKIEAILKRS